MSSRAVLRLNLLAVAAILGNRLPAADATFCIGGSVVNAVSGEPVRRAAVSTPESAALSDAAGTFHFCGLTAGTYATEVEKPGFITAGTRVTVGPSREDLVLRLQPLALITGKVVDGDGNPVEGSAIQLLSFAIGSGRRKVRVEAAQTTDDRGEYRLPQIKPGRYLLRAAGWQGPQHPATNADENTAFVPAYYGGSAELASAAPLTVEAGREISADFSVTLEPSFRIRGKLAGFAAHEPVKVELLGADGEPTAAPAAFDRATGSFQVSFVPHGSYTLRATQGDGEQRLRGEQPVQIGAADVYDLLLPLAGAVQLKGVVHVAAASDTNPVSPSCSVGLSAAETSMYEDVLESATGEDGGFEIDNVLPGRYRLTMNCANGYLASVRAGGVDLLAHNDLLIGGGASPVVEAVLNADGATLDVTPALDDDAAPAWLVLMPDSGNDLYARFSLFKGKLSLSGIAPGDYQLYAWSGSPYAFEYANPSARQSWAGHAVSVQLAARDHQSITVKVPAGEPQ
jgi:hypothetical protein